MGVQRVHFAILTCDCCGHEGKTRLPTTPDNESGWKVLALGEAVRAPFVVMPSDSADRILCPQCAGAVSTVLASLTDAEITS